MAKDQELGKFLKEMEKKMGEYSIVEFGDGVASVEVLPTGIPSLDLALGVGGVPRGRVIEIYGPEAAGKTTIAIKVMVQAQKLAGTFPKVIHGNKEGEGKEVRPFTGRVGFVDVEHAFSPSMAGMHGLNMGRGSGFCFSQPAGGSEALQMLEYMVRSNLFDVIVVDSVAGLTSLDEQDKNIGDKVMAGTAQLMSSGLKKLVPLIGESRTAVIFINQVREKVAVMFGSPETTPGGRALRFYSSIRMRVAKRGTISEGVQAVGHTMLIDIKKNKVAPPFRKTEIDLMYVESKGRPAGFDIFGDMMDVAQQIGVVTLNGSSYTFIDKATGELFKAVGKVKWRALVEGKPELQQAILDEVMKAELDIVSEEVNDEDISD